MANEGASSIPNARKPFPGGNEALRVVLEAVSRRIHAPVADTTALAALADAYDGMVCFVGEASKTAYHYVAAAESGSVEATGMEAGYWNIATDADVDALATLVANGGAALVGTSRGSTAEAELTALIGGVTTSAYHRLFDHADSDVAVDATSVDIDFGDALPADAIVLAVLSNVTEAWDDDGPTDTWEADVGVSSGDADRYTPTPMTLDTQADLGAQVLFLDGSETQLALEIRASGSKKLNELVAGKLDLLVVFAVPGITEIEAPS